MLRKFLFIFFVAEFLISWSATLGASTAKTRYSLSFAIAERPLRQAEPIESKLDIEFSEARSEACFYLPFNDPAFFSDPTQSFVGSSKSAQVEGQTKPVDGMIALNDLRHTQYLSSYLVYMRKPVAEKHWSVPFRFITPRWPDRLGNQYLFSNFYPKLLANCPQPAEPTHKYEIDTSVAIAADVVWPRDWYLATPATEIKRGQFQSNHGDFSFNLSKNYRIENITVDGLPITFVYLSDSFIRLKGYMDTFYRKAGDWFGDFPFDKLVVVESEELEQARVPGIISLNKPKQGGMKVIQDRYLNWIVWQYTEMLCEQWLGAYRRSNSFDNYWFFRGTRGFVVNQILSYTDDAFDIFRKPVKSWFTFNHSQMHDVIAAVRLNDNTDSRLVDEDNKVIETFYNQNNFLFVRHLLAMRYLYWLYGDKFQTAVRKFFQNHESRNLDHRDFLSFLEAQVELDQQGFSPDKILSLWWQSNEWPDFSLLGYELIDSHEEQADSVKKLEVSVGFLKPYIIPIDVVLTFPDGSQISQKIYPKSEVERITIDVPEHPDVVSLNPTREVLDQDRFDNSSKWTDIVFFPGNAKTVRDDAYSVVWGIYPAQLPGEGLSFNTRFSLFRYVQSGVSGTVKYIPSEKNLGVDVRYFTSLKSLGSNISLSYIDNYGQRYKDSRYLSLDLGREFQFNENQSIDFHVKLNAIRDRVEPSRNHVANGVQVNFLRIVHGSSRLSLGLSHDRNLGFSKSFSYRRNTMLLGYEYSQNGFMVGTRVFLGAMDMRKKKPEADVPDSVKFRPQSIQEARIRISRPILGPVNEISSFNLDLYVPAYLPLPSSFFLLPRRARWRLFYDIGMTKEPKQLISAAGAGVVLPIGGDIVGKKSLSFLQFSMLVLGYRRVNDEIYREPSVIFGFSGNI